MNGDLITGEVLGGQTLMLSLQSRGQHIRGALRRAVHEGNTLLVKHIKMDKLSGQVLHRRSGHLSRAVHPVFEETGSQITGGAGVKLAYARIHEYGFDGVVNVREHLRRLKGTKRTNGAKGARRGGDGYTTVRAHTMHMKMPERSFMRSSLVDLTDELRELMIGAARAAAKGDA